LTPFGGEGGREGREEDGGEEEEEGGGINCGDGLNIKRTALQAQTRHNKILSIRAR